MVTLKSERLLWGKNVKKLVFRIYPQKVSLQTLSIALLARAAVTLAGNQMRILPYPKLFLVIVADISRPRAKIIISTAKVCETRARCLYSGVT